MEMSPEISAKAGRDSLLYPNGLQGSKRVDVYVELNGKQSTGILHFYRMFARNVDFQGHISQKPLKINGGGSGDQFSVHRENDQQQHLGLAQTAYDHPQHMAEICIEKMAKWTSQGSDRVFDLAPKLLLAAQTSITQLVSTCSDLDHFQTILINPGCDAWGRTAVPSIFK